jgi:ABC-2 type transport system permease protein
MAPYYSEMYPTQADRDVMALAMTNPALIAISGPPYGLGSYTNGAMLSNFMLVFMGIPIAIMSVLLVARHSRQDEELGRLELVRSMPAGRLANTAASVILVSLAQLAIAILTTIGLAACQIEGIDLAGSLSYSFALAFAGAFFAALTSIFSQLFSSSRTSTGLSFFSIFAFFILRAVGDNSAKALSYISPFGLMHMTESYVRNLAWPHFALLGSSIIAFALALLLSGTRDLGQGLIQAKPGRSDAPASLSDPLGLIFRLLRGSALVWALVVFALSFLIGLLFSDMDGFVRSSELLSAAFASLDFAAVEEFSTMITSIISMIATIPAISFILRARSEERAGYSENVISRSVPRTSIMAACFIHAIASSVVLMALGALGLGVGGRLSLESAPALGVFFKAFLSQLPAIWAMIGLAAAMVGLLPKFCAFSYAYLGYSFLAVYFGSMTDLPELASKLTPYGNVPKIPLESFNIAPLAILAAIAAIAAVAGFWGQSRRDMIFLQ